MHTLLKCKHGVNIVDQKWVSTVWGADAEAEGWILQALAAFGVDVQTDSFRKAEGWVPEKERKRREGL
jgi:hypothetical protein